jgi:hypothetical protein
MIQNIYYTNLRNGTQNFNDLSVGVILKTFEIDGETRMTDRPKMQEGGNFRSFNYMGKQMLHLAGDIIGDTSEEYISRRLNFLSILHPPNSDIQKNRYWGTLYIQYYGQNVFSNQVTMDGYPMVEMGSNPTVSAYTATFIAFTPWWTDVITGKQVLI